MKKISIDYKLVLIITVVFLTRFIAIKQSLWLDEGTTAKVVINYNYLEIITKFLPNDFHPPLYYLFMKLWTNVFGYTEISLRMPSIIASLLTGWLVYLLGKKIKDEKTGRYAMLFFLFNPLIVYYSQEARMYMMTTFFLTVALFFLVDSVRNFFPIKISATYQKIKIFFIGLFLSLALLTFYGSIFFIAAILIYLLYKKQLKTFFVTCFMLCATCLILSPLLYQQLINAKSSLQLVTNWSLVLGKANLKNLLLIPIKFTSGRISFEPKKIYYLVSGCWLLIVVYFIIQNSKFKIQKYNSKLKSIYLFVYLFIFPLLMGFVVSFVTPLLQYFRFLYLIVPMSLLLEIGANKNWQRYLLFLGFLIFSLIYLLNPAFHREDWKSLSQSIPAKSVVYAIPSSMDALRYYDKKLVINELTSSRVNELKNTKEIIIIPYTSQIYGINYQENLKKQQFKLKNTKSFRSLTIEYWYKP